MNTQALAASLGTVEGWKKINKKFLFLFGGGAKSFAVWDSAQEKGVFENELLREEEHEGFHYFLYAFSSQGALGPAVLGELLEAAQRLSLGSIRFESSSYTGLEPIRGFDPPDEDYSIVFLSRPDEGVFVYVVADDKRAYPCTAYARAGGKHHIYPVETKFV